MKKFYLVFFSTLFSVILIYLLFFFYTYKNLHKEFQYNFKSINNLNFHKKYSSKLHHIRAENKLKLLFKKYNTRDLLFSTITEIENNDFVVLFQGDSWMEQMTHTADKNFKSLDLINEFKSKKKINFINAGTASYSPSLMNLQLDVLQEDFNIFPNVVIAYIDQTDLGDELCRYKNNKVYKDGKLVAVKPESHLMYRGLFNYSEIYELSKISLEENSKFIKTFNLINFKFKYGVIKSAKRIYRKYISKSEIDKSKKTKCYYGEIESYLVNSNQDNLNYFSNVLNEYINKITEKKHVEKLFLVTFPHKKHFNSKLNNKKIYKINVSDIVDSLVKDKNVNKISHINLSKKLLNNINFENEKIWLYDNIHLNSEYHGQLLIKPILQELGLYLQNSNQTK